MDEHSNARKEESSKEVTDRLHLQKVREFNVLRNNHLKYPHGIVIIAILYH